MGAEAVRRRIIILPVFNEEKTVEPLVEKILSMGHLLVLADDGSTDGTGDICRRLSSRPNLRLLQWEKNRGKSWGLKSAFELILKMADRGELKDTDLAITTDGDGQLPVEVIDDACSFFEAGGFDLAVGKRDFTIYPFIKKAGNFFLSFIASVLTGVPYKDTQCGFRILSVGALRKIMPFYRARGYGCEQEISVIAPLLGLKTDNSFPIKPVHYRSNSTFKDAFYITLDSFVTCFRVKAGMRAPMKKSGIFPSIVLPSDSSSVSKGETCP